MVIVLKAEERDPFDRIWVSKADLCRQNDYSPPRMERERERVTEVGSFYSRRWNAGALSQEVLTVVKYGVMLMA
jgi:hypothetical protein